MYMALQVARRRLQGGGDDSVRQLSNLLVIYNEVFALRQLSTALRRRCAFLENVQSILRSQNAMLINVVVGSSRHTPAGDRRQPTCTSTVSAEKRTQGRI